VLNQETLVEEVLLPLKKHKSHDLLILTETLVLKIKMLCTMDIGCVPMKQKVTMPMKLRKKTISYRRSTTSISRTMISHIYSNEEPTSWAMVLDLMLDLEMQALQATSLDLHKIIFLLLNRATDTSTTTQEVTSQTSRKRFNRSIDQEMATLDNKTTTPT
jgi:hypothetical protein